MIFSARAFPRLALSLFRGQTDAGEHFLKRSATPNATRQARRFLFLTYGPNPSFDYYFAPRLAQSAHDRYRIIDIRRNEPEIDLLRDSHIVICRYLPRSWRRALDTHAGAIAGLSLFIDDDYLALVAMPSLPLAYRLRVLRDGVALLHGLGTMGGDLLVSTDVLAERYRSFAPIILPPRAPDGVPARPPERTGGETLRIAFHSTASHDREHGFVSALARVLAERRLPVAFDVIASEQAAPYWRDLPGVTLRRPLGWPDFLALTRTMTTDLLLAPLDDTPLNAARSPTKAIDAVRMGAAGLFADLPPYWPLRATGSLLERSIMRWAEEIEHLCRDPDLLASRKALLAAAVAAWSQQANWPANWSATKVLEV